MFELNAKYAFVDRRVGLFYDAYETFSTVLLILLCGRDMDMTNAVQTSSIYKVPVL